MIPFRLMVAIVLAAEVVATVVVAQQLGVLWTFAWWFVTFVLGIVVIRSAGARAWAGLRSAAMRTASASASNSPTERVAPGDTALLFLAGALLAVPGVLTDVLGLLLVLPPSRRLVKRQVSKRVENRFTAASGAIFVRTDDPVVQAGEVIEDEPQPSDDDRPGEGGPGRLPPG